MARRNLARPVASLVSAVAALLQQQMYSRGAVAAAAVQGGGLGAALPVLLTSTT